MSLGGWLKKRARAVGHAAGHAVRAVDHNPVARVVGRGLHAAGSVALLPTEAIVKGTSATVAAATHARWARKLDRTIGREYRRTVREAKVVGPASAVVALGVATGNAAAIAAGASRAVGGVVGAAAPAPAAPVTALPAVPGVAPGSAGAAAGGHVKHRRIRDAIADWLHWLLTGQKAGVTR